MSADFHFPGLHSQLFVEFIAYKRSLGMQYDGRSVRQVRLLATHIAGFPADPRVMTSQMAETFIDQPAKKPATVWKYRSLAIQFARFLLERGFDCWRPPDDLAMVPVTQFVPRIITVEEMARVIGGADRLAPHPCSPFAPQVYGMLLRVLWCCGTRIGETLKLTVADVNTVDGVITLHKTKGGKTRLVPMSRSLNKFAAGYFYQLGIEHDLNAWVFPSLKGGHLSCEAVRHRICGLMRGANVTADSGRPARIHDIRHSYAVSALAQMQSQGMDPYTCLPLLAAFMGHEAIRHTEYYLRLTPATAARIINADASAHPSIYPRVD